MRPIQLHPGLGALVIRQLSELAPLPSKGIVAGQAVASIIDRMQGYASAPVNDIDIFRLAGSAPDDKARASRTLAPTARLQRMGTAATWPCGTDDDAYYALDSYLKQMRSYRVNSVSRDWLLNYVNCVLPFGEAGALYFSPGKVLEAFDLNCVRVAVDLATQRLHWDRHYEAFLRYRCIEVCAVHTPWHTMLRCVKKSKELPDTRVNLKAVATVVTAFHQSQFHSVAKEFGVTSMRFGEKLASLARDTRSEWEPFFRLERAESAIGTSGQEVHVYEFEPRGSVDPKVMGGVNRLGMTALHHIGPSIHSLLRKPSRSAVARAYEVESSLTARDVHVSRFLKANPLGYGKDGHSSAHAPAVTSFLTEYPQFKHLFAGLSLHEQFMASKMLPPVLKSWDGTLLAAALASTDLRSKEALSLRIAELDAYENAQLYRKLDFSFDSGGAGVLATQVLSRAQAANSPALEHFEFRTQFMTGKVVVLNLSSFHQNSNAQSLDIQSCLLLPAVAGDILGKTGVQAARHFWARCAQPWQQSNAALSALLDQHRKARDQLFNTLYPVDGKKRAPRVIECGIRGGRLESIR